MKRLALLLSTVSALAAVDGTVVNKTTGKPQAGVMVALVDLRQGMAPVASSKTDAEGKFRIDKDLPGPQLVQATHEGVGYNKMLPPGTPTSGLTVEVFDATAKPGTAVVSQDMVLVEPGDSEVVVTEAFLLRNDGNVTYSDVQNGTLRFYLPPQAGGKVRVSVTSQGLPVTRAAEKTGQANVFMVKYPVRPGETRFDLSYTVPAAANKLTGKALHSGPVRLIAPTGVTLAGKNLETLGQEPTTKATIYSVKGTSYEVEVTGKGSLRAAAAQAPAESAGGDNEEGPGIQQIKPRLYDKVQWVVGLGLGILAVGFVLLLRNRIETSPAAKGSRK